MAKSFSLTYYLKRILFSLVLIFLLNSLTLYSADFFQYDNKVPKLNATMVTPDYWVDKLNTAHKIIMNEKQIKKYNRLAISKCNKLFDLKNYKLAMSNVEVKQLISKLSKPPRGESFKNGKKLDKDYFNKIAENLNLNNIPSVVKVKFGITVKRTVMNSYPTFDQVFEEADDYEFGRLIETAVYPLEPVAIIHTSKDQKWFLAQSYNYLAWIPADAVAIGKRSEIFQVLDRKKFLVVTGKKVFTVFEPLCKSISELQLDMGVKIPLASKNEIPDEIDGQAPAGNYVVKLPVRKTDGSLEWKLGLISWSDDVNMGYLAYTQENIIKQAFKFIGQRYGWGGMFNARDCSSFIQDNLRTMGLILPRNAGEQGKLALGDAYILKENMSLQERINVFKKIPPATPVYMGGHAMMYIGCADNDYFIIHDFIKLRTKNKNGKMNSYKTRSVYVTPLLSTYLSSGKTYMEGLYTAKRFVIPATSKY